MIWLKRIFLLGIGVIVIYVLSITLFVMSPTISDFIDRTKFDSDEWIKWEDTESTQKVRWNMIHDLTTNYDLNGKTKSEIKNLLGSPSSESENEFRYYLGLTGHGINTGSLTFKFENGKVISHNVWQG